jgi:hypothetical protein
MDVCLLCMSVVNVYVCATGRSLVRRSPTERGVSECDLETSRSVDAYAHEGSRVKV